MELAKNGTNKRVEPISVEPLSGLLCTEKCRFMDKRVREISCFFVALLQREFAPAVWRVSRTLLSRNTSGSVNQVL